MHTSDSGSSYPQTIAKNSEVASMTLNPEAALHRVRCRDCSASQQWSSARLQSLG